MAKEVDKSISLEPLKTVTINLKLIGDTDLILRAKSRSYIRQEIFKQSNPKGTPIPESLVQPYNLFEKLITSINWKDGFPKFDDYSEYTEELWRSLMESETNKPCILSKAFSDAFKETFTTFYKDSTGKNGTDFRRSVSISGMMNPIEFEAYTHIQNLVPTKAVSQTNVISECNVFSGWSCELEITHVPAVFPTETIIAIINQTGQFIGIGSRRGEGFGRFHVDKKVKVTKNK